MNILIHCKNHGFAIHHLLWQIPIYLISSASKPIAITFVLFHLAGQSKLHDSVQNQKRVQKGRIKTELVIGVLGISPRIQTCHWVLPWAVIAYLFQQWSTLGPSHHTQVVEGEMESGFQTILIFDNISIWYVFWILLEDMILTTWLAVIVNTIAEKTHL
jgi:hypothetical protein